MSALDEQVKDFLAETKRLREPVTYEQYRHALGHEFLRWCDRNQIRDVRLLSDELMQRYQNHLMSNDRQSRRGSVRPLAHKSVETYLRIVEAFRHKNGVEGKFRVPRRKESYLDPLTDDEFARIRAEARKEQNEHDELLVTLIWETGLQAGELLGLRKMDLREDPGPRTHLRIVEGRRTRDVPISPGLFDTLKAFASGIEEGPIFLPKRARSRGNELGRIVNRLALSADVRRNTRSKSRSGVTPKLLRISFATRWLRGGGNVVDLQKILGHTSLYMVSELYARLTGSDPFKEMKRLKDAGLI